MVLFACEILEAHAILKLNLRWRHLLSAGDELRKLKTNLGVVDGRRDES